MVTCFAIRPDMNPLDLEAFTEEISKTLKNCEKLSRKCPRISETFKEIVKMFVKMIVRSAIVVLVTFFKV